MDSASARKLAALLRHTRAAALATRHGEEPRASMVAFLPDENFSAFYVLVSKLAGHTTDMLKDGRVSLLVVEADDGRADPLTLARVSIRASAAMISNDDPRYPSLKQSYLARFPQAAPLFQMADFSLWKLAPKDARYVAGFAKAYDLTPDALAEASRL